VDPKTGRGSRVRFEIKTDERGRVVSKKRCTVKGSVLDEIIVASRS
jgi:hypothetical protein